MLQQQRQQAQMVCELVCVCGGSKPEQAGIRELRCAPRQTHLQQQQQHLLASVGTAGLCALCRHRGPVGQEQSGAVRAPGHGLWRPTHAAECALRGSPACVCLGARDCNSSSVKQQQIDACRQELCNGYNAWAGLMFSAS